MSLIVEHLTREYGPQKAVNNISFEVKEGEIVGFLGPNGAGKSTTLKIASSYLPPSSGRVMVGEAADRGSISAILFPSRGEDFPEG